MPRLLAVHRSRGWGAGTACGGDSHSTGRRQRVHYCRCLHRRYCKPSPRLCHTFSHPATCHARSQRPTPVLVSDYCVPPRHKPLEKWHVATTCVRPSLTDDHEVLQCNGAAMVVCVGYCRARPFTWGSAAHIVVSPVCFCSTSVSMQRVRHRLATGAIPQSMDGMNASWMLLVPVRR